MALQLRLVFRLPWRQTQGFLRSLFGLLGSGLDVPDHTTLSRRCRRLHIQPTVRRSSKLVQIFIDATGLKVFGQGEWARAKHSSQGTHAGWRKLHLGVDGDGIIVTSDLTDSDVTDATAFPCLVRKVRSPIKQVTTYGSYDRRKVWRVIDEFGARGVIPLHRRAVLRDEANFSQRNRHLRRIAKVGRAQWRRDSGQDKQAKAENAIGRFKRIFGPAIRARCRDGQRAEVMMGVSVLNRMLQLGTARSIPTSG